MKQLTPQQIKTISNNFQQGQRAIQLGLFNQAEEHFLDVLKINPNIIEAHASLAFVYAASKQHAKATAQLKELLKAKPNHAQTHHNLANTLYEQQLYDEAIIHFKAALKIDPKLVEAYIHCGIAYRMTQSYDNAILHLRHALDLDKANARAFHVLGMIYADIKDYVHSLYCLECATGLAPQHSEYRVSFANVLENASLDFEAGLEYHKACEVNSTYLDAFVSYGAFLSKHHRYDEAVECLERASQLAPENPDIFDELGHAYLGLGDTDAALGKFNSSLETDPKRLSSLKGIGQAYQDIGKLDAAIDLSNQIIAIEPNKPAGYLLKSRVKKSSPGDGVAEFLLRYIANEDLDDAMKIYAGFALGKVFDDHNNYTEAFKYYSIANSLKNKNLNYSIQEYQARFSELINFFDAGLFNSHKNLGVKSDIPVLILGMPRSGTTLTEQIISSHPKVIGAGEVPFWSRVRTAMPLRLETETPYPECIKEMTPAQAKDIAEIYESTLRRIAGPDTNPKHITDKMPHNFLTLGVIALLFPNVKIIHSKRDPIDTCLSIFFQNFLDTHTYSFDLKRLGEYYKQYERIMQHWHKVLPGRIMDINYEDTIADPEFWSRKLIDHIGLDWDDACLAPHKLERSVKTASHWQVKQPIYKTSVQRWKNYEEFLGPLIEALKD